MSFGRLFQTVPTLPTFPALQGLPLIEIVTAVWLANRHRVVGVPPH